MSTPRDHMTRLSASTRAGVTQITFAHYTQLATGPLAELTVRNSLGGRNHPATNARPR